MPPPHIHPPRAAARGLAVRAGLVLASLVLALWGLVSWVEAEKEVRVLCSMASPGKDRGDVERILGTGTFVKVDTTPGSTGEVLVVTSAANLGLSRCTVEVAHGLVTAQTYEERVRAGHVAAGVALAGLGWLVVLQLLLAAGAPLGHMAWGGTHRRLPRRLRVGSAVSAVVLALAALGVVEQAGLAPVTGLPGVVQAFLGVLTLVMLLSTFANAASASAVERRTGTPVAFLLTCAFVVLLLGT